MLSQISNTYSILTMPFLTMDLTSQVTRLILTSLTGLSLTTLALPAAARPEIASGDRLLETNFEGCLDRADVFIETLGVQSDRGEIDRTGYFEDGTFRILCYSVGDSSIAIVFASHNTSADVATSFVRMALDELAVAALPSPNNPVETPQDPDNSNGLPSLNNSAETPQDPDNSNELPSPNNSAETPQDPNNSNVSPSSPNNPVETTPQSPNTSSP